MTSILVTTAKSQLGKIIQNISENYTDLKFIYKNPKELYITNLDKIERFTDINN